MALQWAIPARLAGWALELMTLDMGRLGLANNVDIFPARPLRAHVVAEPSTAVAAFTSGR
jgi:hypothetical protein